MQKPDPRERCGNPGICLKYAQGQKGLKDQPCATHCTDRPQTSGNVTPMVELCPPHPTFRTKVRARRDVPEEEKKMAIIHIHLWVSFSLMGGVLLFCLNKNNIYTIKIKIHSSCEIEYFVESHLCKLCVILRSRVLRVVCPH